MMSCLEGPLLFLVNFPVVSGGFALLASTGAQLAVGAGLGSGGLAAGLIGAGALGVIGKISTF